MSCIYTKRCCLSKISLKDIDEAIEIYLNEKTREFLGGVITKETAKEKLQKLVKENKEVYTVRLKENKQFIGLIYILPYYEKAFYELSYEFLPEFWHQGYAFETVKKILDYCKNVLQLTEIISETQKKNMQSRKLLEKLGYKKLKEVIRFSEMQLVYYISL